MRSKLLLACLVGLLLLFASFSSAEMRTWTRKNGKMFEAEFVKVEKDSDGKLVITLRKADGTEMTVHPPGLSDDDRKYVKEMAKPQGNAEARNTNGKQVPPTTPASSSAVPSPTSPRSSRNQKPSWSSSIALTPDGSELWAVNEDNNSVTALSVLDKSPFLQTVAEIPVGLDPRTLAVSPDGNTVYVANRHSASFAVIDRIQKEVLGFVGLGWASQPYGIVASPDGRYVYVSTYATAKVHQVDVTDRLNCRVEKSVHVAGHPWAIAITADGQRLFVTKGIESGSFQSKDPARVTRVDTRTFDTKMIPLAKDNTRDTGGYVSMLRSIVILPQGDRALIACQQIDSDRGITRDKKASLSFKTEVQPVLSVLDLKDESELRKSRVVLSQVGSVINTPSAAGLLTAKKKTFALVVGQGSDDVKIVGWEGEQPTERALVRVGGILGQFPTGAAPDGICMDSSRNRAYVLNFLNRSVSVLAISEPLIETKEIAEVRVSDYEPLPHNILIGKKLFHSSEFGTSKDSWISCANCHPDGGGTDGRVWDFSQFGGHRGEKARTLSLRGTTGYRARLFWQGRADEVQDLENGVRLLFGGQLIRGKTNQNLGKPNAGLSKRFDAVADYITSLRRVQPSPFRTQGGQLNEAAQKGRELFYREGCSSCHLPECRFCNSSHLKPKQFEPEDVGTGGAFNVPCLVGTWENGTWLHDGRAAHLHEALTGNKMVRSGLPKTAVDQLAAFVHSIDEGGDVRSATGTCRNNQAPVIEVPHLQPQMRVEAGVPHAFLGSRSFDPDGNITSWVWSFHDGSPAQEVEARTTFGDVVHVFPPRAATYRVSLKVTDDQGGSAEKTWYIGVGCKPDPDHVYKP